MLYSGIRSEPQQSALDVVSERDSFSTSPYSKTAFLTAIRSRALTHRASAERAITFIQELFEGVAAGLETGKQVKYDCPKVMLVAYDLLIELSERWPELSARAEHLAGKRGVTIKAHKEVERASVRSDYSLEQEQTHPSNVTNQMNAGPELPKKKLPMAFHDCCQPS